MRGRPSLPSIIKALGAGLLLVAALGPASAAAPAPGLQDLVFFADDDASPRARGCDAITLADVRSGQALAHGEFRDSIQRITAHPSGELAVAPVITVFHELYVLKRLDPARDSWATGWVEVPGLLEGGPALFSPDGEWLFLAIQGAVTKYAARTVTTRAVGPVVGRYRAAGLEASSMAMFGHTLLVTDTRSRVHVIDGDSMTLQAPVMAYDPPDTRSNYQRRTVIRRTFSAVSPVGALLVVNGGYRGTVTIIDTQQRTVREADVEGFSETWGVAFDHSPVNLGLLAIHGFDQVGVFRLLEGKRLAKLAEVEVPPQDLRSWWILPFTARYSPLAWTGRGDAVVAAIGAKKEFRVLDFDRERGVLSRRLDMDACQSGQALKAGVDVVTLNQALHVPTPTLTPSPTETPRVSTTTPTPTPTPTRTPTLVTPAPTASATATPRPVVYLPLVLKEQCLPEERSADVLLVIDASTSMLEEASPGRTKAAAAREASVRLVELLGAEDQAGIVWFNEVAELEQPLTADRKELVAAIGRVPARPFTRIDLGIQAAREELTSARREPGNRPVMLVLTDGKANPVGPDAAVAQGQRAKEAGITIFTIGLGTPENLDDGALRQIASRPEYYYQTPNPDELTAIYEKIAGAIPCPRERYWGRR